MNIALQIYIILKIMVVVNTTIDGISYLDEKKTAQDKYLPSEDPCNPLYWYPRNIPEYCILRHTIEPILTSTPSIPIPLPMPIPQFLPQPSPWQSIPPMPPPMLPIPPPILPIPPPMLPVPPPLLPIPPPMLQMSPSMLPISLPSSSISVPNLMPSFYLPNSAYRVPSPQLNPLLPGFQSPFSNFQQNSPGSPQAGFVPGLPGLVSRDGGINILPFSDVYSDMLEKHKNKMIRKKLQKVLANYEHRSNRKSYRRLKKFKRHFE